MKIGIKTYNNRNFLEHFKDKVDFFEIMAIESVNYDFIKEFNLPMVIHSQHRLFDINIADKTKHMKNLNSINFARRIADSVNAKKIIIHPGEIENQNCSIETAIEFLKSINDKRIIIENVHAEKNIPRLGTTPEDLKEILKKTKNGFCFDINHGIFSAIELKQDYLQYIKEFVKLKPIHYHLGGQIIKDLSLPLEKREHLALKESDFNLKEVLKLIPRDAQITLETTTDIKKTEDDIKIMKEIKKELKL